MGGLEECDFGSFFVPISSDSLGIPGYQSAASRSWATPFPCGCVRATAAAPEMTMLLPLMPLSLCLGDGCLRYFEDDNYH